MGGAEIAAGLGTKTELLACFEKVKKSVHPSKYLLGSNNR
jgi:hypothetical protein